MSKLRRAQLWRLGLTLNFSIIGLSILALLFCRSLFELRLLFLSRLIPSSFVLPPLSFGSPLVLLSLLQLLLSLVLVK